LRRIEFGDNPLEAKTEAAATQRFILQPALAAPPGTAPQAGQPAAVSPAPQIIMVPVRPRYDRIFLRNGTA